MFQLAQKQDKVLFTSFVVMIVVLGFTQAFAAETIARGQYLTLPANVNSSSGILYSPQTVKGQKPDLIRRHGEFTTSNLGERVVVEGILDLSTTGKQEVLVRCTGNSEIEGINGFCQTGTLMTIALEDAVLAAEKFKTEKAQFELDKKTQTERFRKTSELFRSLK